jgi:hypothetical protein
MAVIRSAWAIGRQVAVLGGGAMVRSCSRVTSWLLACQRCPFMENLHRVRCELQMAPATSVGLFDQAAEYGRWADYGPRKLGGQKNRCAERRRGDATGAMT